MQAPGEALVAKLWETVAEKGIGGLLRPWQLRREGRAAIDMRREEMLSIAQASVDAEKIRRGEASYVAHGSATSFPDSSGVVPVRIEPRIDPKALADLCADIRIADEVRRSVNVTTAVLHAETELEGADQEPPSESVNDDWLYRWRDSASEVSAEELQNLWGRVLAGEIKHPGRFSLRTLEFLRNLSKEEALGIEKLSQFQIDGFIFRDAAEILQQSGVSFGFLLSMQQLGVISGCESIGLEMTRKSVRDDTFVCPMKSNGMVLVVRGTDTTARVKLPVYQVSTIGSQVMSLGKFNAHVSYLKKVGAYIKAQGFEVDLAKYVDVSPSEIQYFFGEKL